MVAQFPEEPKAKRQALLDTVESLRDVILAGVEESEAKGTMPRATVDAIYESGLFSFKSARVLGGAEADAMTQLDVIEAASAIDASTGWCVMIGSGTLANLSAFLSDEAIDEIYVGGKPPKAAGAAAPSGKALSVEGGYRVTGRWSYGSGIPHSEWVAAGAMVVDADGKDVNPPEQIRIVMPRSDVKVYDNWQVVGLRGTGSCDFSVSEVFVPQRFTWGGEEAKPKRGGPNHLLGRPGMQTTGHSGVALGIGRQALETVTDLAQTKKRGYRGTSALIADRGSFQWFLGESDMRLRGAKAVVLEIIEEAWASVCDGITPPLPLLAKMRASTTFATEEASAVVSQAFRFGGATAMFSDHVLQKCLRDVHASAQHQMVSDRAYENYGQFLLEFPDANPMG